MTKETHYRVIKAYCDTEPITPKSKPVKLLHSQECETEKAAWDMIENHLDGVLTSLNNGKDLMFGEPVYSVITEQKNGDGLILRRRRTARSYWIEAYYNVYPLEIETVIVDPNDPDRHRQWKYRGYHIFKNDKGNRFTIKFINMKIGMRHSLEAALKFIDEYLTEELILRNGRIYYAG